MQLPEVIFGTSGLGNLYTIMPDEIKLAIIDEYIKATDGDKIPFFDTAGKYGAGLALESLGQCLSDLKVEPEKVLISNKLGWIRTPLLTPEPTFEPGVWKGLKYDAVQKISYEGILECYDQGNELLGEYNSAYVSVHDPDEYLAAAIDAKDEKKRYQDILGAYEALSELKQQGKAQAIGVGAKNWRSIERICNDVKLDWVMIANSVTVQSHPKDLLKFMKKLDDQGIFSINSAVFNAGFLTGGDFYNYKFVDPETTWGSELVTWRNQFYDVCTQYNIAPPAACVKFGMAAPGVKSVAVSTTNPKRVASNIALVNAEIPDAFWQELNNKGLITTEGLEMMLGVNE